MVSPATPIDSRVWACRQRIISSSAGRPRELLKTSCVTFKIIVTTLARHLLESLGRRRRGAICGRHIAGRLHISFSCQTRPSKLGKSDLRLFSRSEIKFLNRKGVCIISLKRPGSVFVVRCHCWWGPQVCIDVEIRSSRNLRG